MLWRDYSRHSFVKGHLMQCRLFNDITENEQEKMLECAEARDRDFKPGEYIFRQGEVPSSIYLIKKGTVMLVKDFASGKRNVLYSVHENDVFGEMFVFSTETAYWFDAVANAGYCICVAGTADKDNNCAVFYTGLVRNSSAETSVTKLIGENPSGYVLGRLYPAWYRMTTGESGAKDTTLFQNPAYYSNSLYKGCGKAGAAVYQKAVNNTIDLLNGKTDISPYQNSINKVLW